MASKRILIDGSIPGILSHPDVAITTSTKLSAVLLLHGFGSHKDEVNAVYQEMASMCEANNIVSLRIDFSGYGESDKNPEDSSLDTMIADAKSAFDYLIALPYVEFSSIGIVGFSLGAAVAMLLTQSVSCRALALLSPAVNLAKDFTGFLGQSVMNELSHCDHFVDVDLSWRKIKIGRKFYESLFQHDPSIAIENFRGSLFCLAGENDFSSANAKDIFYANSSENKYIKVVNDADHIFSAKNGDSKLLKSASKAVSWLQKNLMLPANSNHLWHSEVQDHELDFQKIVNNSYYLHYFDQARIHFLLSKGVDCETWHNNGFNLVLVHADLSLKASLTGADQFYVASTMERSGRLRILFKQKIYRKPDNKLIAEALNTVVCVSISNSKPLFPDQLKNLLFNEQKTQLV